MGGKKYMEFQTPMVPPSVALEIEAIKGGDKKVYCIAAASILAKVTRDRLMHAYDREWPQYGLANHKGYATAMHMARIEEHGPCPIHRRTFAPLKERAYPAATQEEAARVAAIEAALQSTAPGPKQNMDSGTNGANRTRSNREELVQRNPDIMRNHSVAFIVLFAGIGFVLAVVHFCHCGTIADRGPLL